MAPNQKSLPGTVTFFSLQQFSTYFFKRKKTMPSNDKENLKQIALTRFEKMGFKHFGANAHFSSSTPCSAPGGKFLEAF